MGVLILIAILWMITGLILWVRKELKEQREYNKLAEEFEHNLEKQRKLRGLK
jgi:hypothetical protein